MPNDDRNSSYTPEQSRQEGRREAQNQSAAAPRQYGETQKQANDRQGAHDDYKNGK